MNRPEAVFQEKWIAFLSGKQWFVKSTHGNLYQSGFPDLYCTHSRFGQRWVEIKLPGMKGSRFTAAQLENFPKFVAFGAGVWILTECNEREYEKLFKPCNWWQYLQEMIK